MENINSSLEQEDTGGNVLKPKRTETKKQI